MRMIIQSDGSAIECDGNCCASEGEGELIARTKELEQHEQHKFKVVKEIAKITTLLIIGAYLIIHIPDILHIHSYTLPIGFKGFSNNPITLP